MLGFNTYFGWYAGVSNFDSFEPYLAELRDIYPSHALVVTEFGAEARPELAGGAPFDRVPVGVERDDHRVAGIDVVSAAVRALHHLVAPVRELDLDAVCP